MWGMFARCSVVYQVVSRVQMSIIIGIWDLVHCSALQSR